MIVKPGTFRLKRSLNNQVARIFANGQDGFWYDPLLPYLYDTSTGVAQVDAAEDLIGLWIDRSKGAGLGAEKCVNGTFDSSVSWSTGTGWAISGGVASASIVEAQQLVQAQGLVGGKAYQVKLDVIVTSGVLDVSVGGATSASISTSGSYTLNLVNTAAGNQFFYLYTMTAFVGSVDNISVKLLDGNHAIQATAAARLTYRLDSGLPYAAALGTDDSVTSATGGGGTAGFCYVAALKPTGGAGTLRTLWSDAGTNTGRKVQIDTNNKLSFSAGNGTAFTTLASTATLDVGTKYVVTVRDNGTNLSVQINTAAAETVASPVVAAGTAGFTQFKDNGAASSFLIADVYHVDGTGNSALTDAQVASLQAYARSRIGL